ncbi:MAG: metal ABC transporter permease [Nitrososphaerota archaeon]|nr:metal ABC transporter permease [Candidatus Calditenuaceae archaeon]MDW8073414.1 metal ABC transporter permease [Nitrososphaerota archaeon]
MLDILAEPLSYEFMRIALVTSMTVAVTCSILSSFVVLRGWSLLGDAVSHSILPGIAIALALEIPYLVGALLAGIGSSALIGLVESRARIRNDTAIGVVMTGAFAFGLILLSWMRPAIDVFHVLFGNPIGVSFTDMTLSAIIGGAIVLIVALLLKEIVAYTFDPVFSKVIGIPTAALHYLLMILLSLAIVSALNTVGIILVITLLVTPGATAQVLSRNMTQMLTISMLVGVSSAVVGLYLSYYLSISSGGAIAGVATVIFFTALGLKTVRRWLKESED